MSQTVTDNMKPGFENFFVVQYNVPKSNCKLDAQSNSITFKRSRCLKFYIRELSIDGGENVTKKVNSRFFTLCRVYSSSLKTSNGKRERERKIRRRLLTSSIKREIKHFHVV